MKFDIKRVISFIKLNIKYILYLLAAVVVIVGIVIGIIFACNKSKKEEVARAQRVLHYPTGNVTAGIAGKTTLMQKVALHVERDKYVEKTGDGEYANATEEERQIISKQIDEINKELNPSSL